MTFRYLQRIALLFTLPHPKYKLNSFDQPQGTQVRINRAGTEIVRRGRESV